MVEDLQQLVRKLNEKAPALNEAQGRHVYYIPFADTQVEGHRPMKDQVAAQRDVVMMRVFANAVLKEEAAGGRRASHDTDSEGEVQIIANSNEDFGDYYDLDAEEEEQQQPLNIEGYEEFDEGFRREAPHGAPKIEDFWDRFKRLGEENQNNVLRAVAAKTPLIVQHGQPDPFKARPGDIVNIMGHGSLKKESIFSLDRNVPGLQEVTADQVVQRLHDDLGPDVTNIKLNTCGAPDKFMPALHAACQTAGKFTDATIRGYAKSTVSEFNETNGLQFLDRGSRFVTTKELKAAYTAALTEAKAKYAAMETCLQDARSLRYEVRQAVEKGKPQPEVQNLVRDAKEAGQKAFAAMEAYDEAKADLDAKADLHFDAAKKNGVTVSVRDSYNPQYKNGAPSQGNALKV